MNQPDLFDTSTPPTVHTYRCVRCHEDYTGRAPNTRLGNNRYPPCPRCDSPVLVYWKSYPRKPAPDTPRTRYARK